MFNAGSGSPALRSRPCYRGKVEHPHAATVVGTATALHATRLVELAFHRRLDIVVHPRGALDLVRTRGGRLLRRVRLEPYFETQPRHVSTAQARDLRLVLTTPARLMLDQQGALRVRAGRTQIPPTATEQLVRLGWLTTPGRAGDPVELSVGGRMALAFHTERSAGERDGRTLALAMLAAITPFRPSGGPCPGER